MVAYRNCGTQNPAYAAGSIYEAMVDTFIMASPLLVKLINHVEHGCHHALLALQASMLGFDVQVGNIFFATVYRHGAVIGNSGIVLQKNIETLCF